VFSGPSSSLEAALLAKQGFQLAAHRHQKQHHQYKGCEKQPIENYCHPVFVANSRSNSERQWRVLHKKQLAITMLTMLCGSMLIGPQPMPTLHHQEKNQ